MKRVRPDEACRIPCEGIVDLLVDSKSKTFSFINDPNPPNCFDDNHGSYLFFLGAQMKVFDPSIVDSYTLNVSLAFLTIGIMRCTLEEAESILPLFLLIAGAYCTRDSLVSVASRNQSSQINHIILRLLAKVVVSDQPRVLDPQIDKDEGMGDNLQRGRNTELVQSLLRHDDAVSMAVYDLLLDVLLYQSMPVDKDLPPPGLSLYANERLKCGASAIAKDWREEYLSTIRLVDLKKKVLEWIAPCRRWDPFLTFHSTAWR